VARSKELLLDIGSPHQERATSPRSFAPFVIRRMKQCNTSLSRVFAREVWSLILQRLELLTVAPQARPSAVCFTDWWCKAIQGVDKELRKGLNSLIILVVCKIWKHHNECVFNGARPSVTCFKQLETNVWFGSWLEPRHSANCSSGCFTR
jgi:hypothetical protein